LLSEILEKKNKNQKEVKEKEKIQGINFAKQQHLIHSFVVRKEEKKEGRRNSEITGIKSSN